MKKAIVILSLICLCVCVFAGCGKCEHEWEEANCTTPKTCRICGTTDGASLGHNWQDANCSAPKTCAICNITEGEPADHSYVCSFHEPTEFEGGYTTYFCTVCGHSYDADHTEPLGYELTEGTFIFRADGVAYLYGPDGEVVQTYSGWTENVYEVFESPGAIGSTVPWVNDYFEGNFAITRVIIEDGVNPVSTDAWFGNCRNLETVIIGDDIVELGRGMFEGCSGLTRIIFGPNSQLKTIDDRAFSEYIVYDSYSSVCMPEFSIPESVTYLGDLPVTDVPVSLHEGLLGIGADVLSCGEVVLPNSVSEVGVGNFDYLSIPEDHPYYSMVNNCLIHSVTKTLIDVRDGFEIPNDGSVLAIGERVFEGLDIQQIALPDGLIEIGENAFSKCMNLTSVTIPDSVTHIGANAFYQCHNLGDIRISAGIISIGDYAFQGCYGILELTLPDGLVSIGRSAFSGWECLQTVHIPSTVAEIGVRSFAGCQNLEEMTVAPENTEYYVNNNCLIGRTEKIVIAVAGDASLPDDGSIAIIADDVFCARDQLVSVIVPDGVTDIGDTVFYECDNLELVVLPVSLAYMGQQCFSHSPHLRIEYKGTMAQWRNIGRNQYFAMSGCDYIVKCIDGEYGGWD